MLKPHSRSIICSRLCYYVHVPSLSTLSRLGDLSQAARKPFAFILLIVPHITLAISMKVMEVEGYMTGSTKTICGFNKCLDWFLWKVYVRV